MNKFAAQAPVLIVISEKPYVKSAAMGAKAKNNDYKWLLQKCLNKMSGYGEFEVLIRKINDYL